MEKEWGDLQKTWEDIYRSRAWRTSIFLRKLYLTFTAPWRRVRDAFTRGRKSNP